MNLSIFICISKARSSSYGCLFMLVVLHFIALPIQADQNDSRLEGLFKSLKNTTLSDRASVLEDRIWQIWMEHPKTKVRNSLALGIAALNNRRFEEALDGFGLLTRLEPKFAEGWNKRATVLYLMGRFRESEEDVRRTLELEPRHFGALSGLGLIRMAEENWAGAIEALEAGLRIHPNMSGALQNLEYARKKQKESLT